MEDGEIEEGMVTEEALPQQPPQKKPEKSPQVILRETKTSVEDIVSKMLSIKNDRSNPKSEIRELVTQMFLNFINLRQANRATLLEEDRVKAETERAKTPVDFTTLQLHNLMYEKSHYVKAIKACKDFKSKYPDIELVPEEEFLKDAPEDIKAPRLSSDSSHDLMLKRLNFELYQRKELCKLRARLEQQKKILLETIANRKKFLTSLPSHLKSLKKASLPVQNQLGIHHTKKLKQHHLAELLPPPLYIIHSQFSAQKEAFEEHIDLEIVGSLKDAQAFARQQANKDSGTSNDADSSKLEDDAPDEDDDGQRRRKRPKKAPTKEGLDQAGIYQVHPLKIMVHIYDETASDPKSVKLITLKFDYLLKLNVVCVGIEGSQEGSENNILCNLFPDDTGLELPHQSAKLILGDVQAFDENRTSRPYKWVQHLAGIDFLPEVSPFLNAQDALCSNNIAKNENVVSGLSLYRQQNRVETVLQRIRSRKKAQLALTEHLDSLVKLEWPALNCEGVPWALHNPICSLHSWSPVGPSDNLSSSLLPYNNEQVHEPKDVDMDGKSASSKEELEGAREDGELPSLVTASSTPTDFKITPTRGANLDHSRHLTLIPKSLISPVTKGKSPSFKKYHDDYLDLMLDADSDIDEPAQTEAEEEDASYAQYLGRAEKSWVDYGAREFCLVLSREKDAGGKNVKLEAKVKISMEYPLRPPLFALSLRASSGNNRESDDSERYNELRAMEAEVNLYMLKMILSEQENYTLAHQVRCLAMLFDYYMDESSLSSGRRKSTSLMDVGLCAPVSGKLIARSFRGRDRRKMISWKDVGCASGYPS